MAVTNDEKIEILQEVITKMDECSELLRSLKDERINAYCLADFEGRDGGWLGEFVRDILEQQLAAARQGGDADDD